MPAPPPPPPPSPCCSPIWTEIDYADFVPQMPLALALLVMDWGLGPLPSTTWSARALKRDWWTALEAR